jgi:hypothetical protein
MGQAMSVHEDNIRACLETLEGFEDHRSFSERKKTWHIREIGSDGGLGDGNLSTLMCRPEHDRGVEDGVEAAIGNIRGGNEVPLRQRVPHIDQLCECLLDAHGFRWRCVPGMQRSQLHRCAALDLVGTGDRISAETANLH